jgi:hypothetical protein
MASLPYDRPKLSGVRPRIGQDCAADGVFSSRAHRCRPLARRSEGRTTSEQASAQRVRGWDLIAGGPVDPLQRSLAAGMIVSMEDRYASVGRLALKSTVRRTSARRSRSEASSRPGTHTTSARDKAASDAATTSATSIIGGILLKSPPATAWPHPSATFSTSFPKFSPANSFSSASGNVSKPVTISSRDLSLPSRSQPPMIFAASG